MNFPVPYVPKDSYTGSRGWYADRPLVAIQLKVPGGVLKHMAVDLVVPIGTPVLAMDTGTVTRKEEFYPRRPNEVGWAVAVQHPDFLARYCEISGELEVGVGDEVEAGQVIGYTVGQFVQGWGRISMLHLELYRGTSSGKLTTDIVLANAPTFRRKDVFNPTPTLDALRDKTSKLVPSDYTYEKRGSGKFIVPRIDI